MNCQEIWSNKYTLSGGTLQTQQCITCTGWIYPPLYAYVWKLHFLLILSQKCSTNFSFQLKCYMKQPNSTHRQEALQSCMENFNILVIQKTACYTFRSRWAGWVWICLYCQVCWVCWFATCSVHFPPAHTPRSKVQYVTILRKVKYLHLQVAIQSWTQTNSLATDILSWKESSDATMKFKIRTWH